MNHGLRISGSQFGTALGFSFAGRSPTRLYAGAERPAAEVATVRSIASCVSTTKITHVDGRPLGLNELDAEVLPGHHVVWLAFSEGLLHRDAALDFDAKAGHAYEVHACAPGIHDHELWTWVTDPAEHAIVAGERPSYD